MEVVDEGKANRHVAVTSTWLSAVMFPLHTYRHVLSVTIKVVDFMLEYLGPFYDRTSCESTMYTIFLSYCICGFGLLGHLLRDDLINPVKMSICLYVCPSVHPQSNAMQLQTK